MTIKYSRGNGIHILLKYKQNILQKHKTNLSTFKRMKIIQDLFSGHNEKQSVIERYLGNPQIFVLPEN